MVEPEISTGRRTHVLAFPWPGQGHLNPMLQFSNILALRGLKVTVITTTSTHTTAQINSSNFVNFDFISDGSDDRPKDAQEHFAIFNSTVSQSLAEIIEKYKNSSDPPKVLVYDSLMTWALDVAREKGLIAACLFTQSSSVCSIYYKLLQQGKDRSANSEGRGVATELPLPEMDEDDMPCFSYFKGSSQVIQDYVVGQICNIDKLDWIFFNTFYKLEEEVVEWMTSQWPVKAVGPLFLSSYLQNQKKNRIDAGINLFKPTSEVCKEWLDTRETGSVIYISFGSAVRIPKEEMEEIASGIAASNYSFLWVVRETEEIKLPETFKTETSEKGLIVNWCPQLEVLNHKAIACFMTHCGWNSTLEALSLGVPMILMPHFVDQTTNAKFIEDVWKVGVRIRKCEGVVTRDGVEKGLHQVMKEERLKVLQENACEIKSLAIKAVQEGGSSYANIDEFVSMIA